MGPKCPSGGFHDGTVRHGSLAAGGTSQVFCHMNACTVEVAQDMLVDYTVQDAKDVAGLSCFCFAAQSAYTLSLCRQCGPLMRSRR